MVAQFLMSDFCWSWHPASRLEDFQLCSDACPTASYKLKEIQGVPFENGWKRLNEHEIKLSDEKKQ